MHPEDPEWDFAKRRDPRHSSHSSHTSPSSSHIRPPRQSHSDQKDSIFAIPSRESSHPSPARSGPISQANTSSTITENSASLAQSRRSVADSPLSVPKLETPVPISRQGGLSLKEREMPQSDLRHDAQTTTTSASRSRSTSSMRVGSSSASNGAARDSTVGVGAMTVQGDATVNQPTPDMKRTLWVSRIK